jgi:hypothetical protein
MFSHLAHAVRAGLLVCLATALVACSSEKKTQPGLGQIAISMARARLQKASVETVNLTSKPPQITRAQIEAVGRPAVFVTIPRAGSAVAAFELTQNRGFKTYMGGDQSTITLQNDIITATRGLGVDLIAQDLSISPSALFTGTFPKTYKRRQRHLTGEGTLATFEFTCAIIPAEKNETITVFDANHPVRQFTELCQNTQRAFQNSYWVDLASGIVWQSHQSVSKEVGHVIVQRVVR